MNERRFVEAVRDALRTSRIDLGRPIVAAVSGGADSMAMLESLRELGESGDVELVAAHFNHGIRGAESDADERFVIDWCAARGIQSVTGRVEPARSRSASMSGTRERDESPEAAARRARYAFLSRVQTDLGASAVATGHTIDDQAETVLLHLVRGSGLTGLQGMRLVSHLNLGRGARKVTVVRPLLGLGRADTEGFCASRGIVPRHDATNEDLSIPRNRIRREVLGPLRSINPAVTTAIARLTAAARDDVDFLSSRVDAVWKDLGSDMPGASASASRAKFRKLHPALKRRVLIKMYAVVTGLAEGLALDHIEAMMSLAEGRPGASLDLPGGVRFEVGYRGLTLLAAGIAEPSDSDCPFPPAVQPCELPVPGSVDLGDGFILRAEVGKSHGARRATKWVAYLKRSSIGDRVSVRSRLRGDRFMPSGMAVEKKLQDFFVNSKVPRSWRDRVPLAAGERGIAWVVGYRVAEWARADETGPAVRLSVVPRNRRESGPRKGRPAAGLQDPH